METSFRLCLQGPQNIDEIINELKESSGELTLDSVYSGELEDNYYTISENEDYDEKLVTIEDGFLYYQYHLDIFPKSDFIELESQIVLSKKIAAHMQKVNFKCEIIADFEHLL